MEKMDKTRSRTLELWQAVEKFIEASNYCDQPGITRFYARDFFECTGYGRGGNHSPEQGANNIHPKQFRYTTYQNQIHFDSSFGGSKRFGICAANAHQGSGKWMGAHVL